MSAIDLVPLRASAAVGLIEIIDQTQLPERIAFLRIENAAQAAHAIRSMQVRGAPLIGATAAYGLALAFADDPSDANLWHAHTLLLSTRPTAINLKWALDACAPAVARYLRRRANNA